MSTVRLYTTSWCADCQYAKQFLRERGISFEEINVDEDPDAEELILRVNDGLRKAINERTRAVYAEAVA